MTLLTEMMTRPLDPGYAAAAERRRQRARSGDARAGDDERGTRARSPLAVAVLLLVGVLLAMAFVQTRGERPSRVDQRDQLIAEITREDDAASALQRRNAAALVELGAERTRRLEQQAQGDLADDVSRLALVTGAVAATGPGIVLTVNDAVATHDAAPGDPRADAAVDDGRVLDQDLQLIVNGLWAAGAEAVAINGQRLTALSAIRSAGAAILVDYRPLSPPYRIVAIGDPQRLQKRFSDGPGGHDLRYLEDNFGVRASITSGQGLTVQASAGVDTRRARSMSPTGTPAHHQEAS